MVEKIGHIKNPLTVIAMFAAIAEISGTTVLPFIESDNQSIYIWFLMIFPMFLVGIFFITLNFNHKVLYAPSDYKNEDNFLKSIGKATAQEKEEKLREEVEETEEQTDLSKTDAQKKEQLGSQTHNTTRQRNSELMANVTLAEKLAINKLSKELGTEFRTDVRFETPSNRKIIFDGFAIQNDKLHVAEVKLFRSEHFSPAILDRLLLEIELMRSKLDDKDIVLHFIAVIDNLEVRKERVQERLSRYMERYNINVKLQVVTLEDLQNEYQYNS